MKKISVNNDDEKKGKGKKIKKITHFVLIFCHLKFRTKKFPS